MTFEDFISKWTGKPIDFDGVYPNQCMDLMHEYVYEVLGITDKTVLARPWAAQVYTNFTWETFFDKTANSPTGVPEKGDIILWAESINYDSAVGHGYGHVSIFVSGDANNFKSFDANWPTGSLPHIQDHNYNGVLGWLKPKITTTDPLVCDPRSVRDALVTKATAYDSLKLDYDKLSKLLHDNEETNKQKDDVIKNLNQQINDRNNDIVKLNAQISTLQSQVTDLTTRRDSAIEQAKLVPQLTKENQLYADKLRSYQEAEKTWNRSRAQLQKQIDDLKKNALKALISNIFRI